MALFGGEMETLFHGKPLEVARLPHRYGTSWVRQEISVSHETVHRARLGTSVPKSGTGGIKPASTRASRKNARASVNDHASPPVLAATAVSFT